MGAFKHIFRNRQRHIGRTQQGLHLVDSFLLRLPPSHLSLNFRQLIVGPGDGIAGESAGAEAGQGDAELEAGHGEVALELSEGVVEVADLGVHGLVVVCEAVQVLDLLRAHRGFAAQEQQERCRGVFNVFQRDAVVVPANAEERVQEPQRPLDVPIHFVVWI